MSTSSIAVLIIIATAPAFQNIQLVGGRTVLKLRREITAPPRTFLLFASWGDLRVEIDWLLPDGEMTIDASKVTDIDLGTIVLQPFDPPESAADVEAGNWAGESACPTRYAEARPVRTPRI